MLDNTVPNHDVWGNTKVGHLLGKVSNLKLQLHHQYVSLKLKLKVFVLFHFGDLFKFTIWANKSLSPGEK